MTLANPENTERESRQFQLSIRSFLLVMLSVALLCAFYDQIPHDSIALATIAVFAAWSLTGASIGFDLSPTRHGLFAGFVMGFLTGGIVLICFFAPVVRE